LELDVRPPLPRPRVTAALGRGLQRSRPYLRFTAWRLMLEFELVGAGSVSVEGLEVS
jgi:hypothetical protein